MGDVASHAMISVENDNIEAVAYSSPADFATAKGEMRRQNRAGNRITTLGAEIGLAASRRGSYACAIQQIAAHSVAILP